MICKKKKSVPEQQCTQEFILLHGLPLVHAMEQILACEDTSKSGTTISLESPAIT